ncbi:hypothetical protein HID58_084287 [Brassica napus]|uniref:Uncharacterized protein n=1 Tax=Brassica napus TaxID=3708 RepID=A0ABQ7XJI5_BRANA|nr:hypothetical protein HID58_084287 [Brassica napus]
MHPLPLSFSSIGTFSSDNNALFLSPTPSLALLQLQAQLCDVVKKEGVEAVDVARARMAEAFSILRELKMPVNVLYKSFDLDDIVLTDGRA